MMPSLPPPRRRPIKLPLSAGVGPLFHAGFVLMLTLPATCPAAPRHAKPSADNLVDQALNAEAAGDAAARSEMLSQAMSAASDDPRVRWAAGYVKQDGQWRSFDAPPQDSKQSQTLADYREMRARLPETIVGQLELANWCHQHGLKEQEQAHLTRALDFAPDRSDLRARLGLVQVGGVWLRPREAREAALRSKQTWTDFSHWRSRAERLRAALNPPGRAREVALDRIRAVQDPSAALALETLVAPADDDAGAAVADALAHMYTPEAALALARMATFSDSSDTADAARKHLKSQPADDYIPAMLSALVSPDTVQTQIATDRRGNFLFRQMFLYEGADQKRLAVFDDIYTSLTGQNADAQLAAGAIGSAAVALRSRVAGFVSRHAERMNGRICDTLRYVTGQDLPPDPQRWWQWWNNYNETVPVGSKPTEVIYVRTNTALRGRSAPRFCCSCLVAGTPVWTDEGPTAIEQIRIGDRVLAQDPITGELAYRPVVRTTVRDRSALVHVRLPDETIVATGGHPFWVAGRGWLIARHLEAGMLLHGVTGARRIETVASEPEGDEPVYNLVVEEFHNYFVGDSRVLLHDITPRQPTRGPLPGLVGRPTAANGSASQNTR